MNMNMFINLQNAHTITILMIVIKILILDWQMSHTCPFSMTWIKLSIMAKISFMIG